MADKNRIRATAKVVAPGPADFASLQLDTTIRTVTGGAAIQIFAVGDQIHFEGYLSSYSNASGFHRGTSTIRTDTGNGACETVYVTEFDISDPAPRGWRKLQSAALWGLLLSSAAWLLGVGKGWF